MTPQVLAALFGGAAAGAVLTALNTLVTGWLTRRHERQRWLLDQRLDIYSDFNQAMAALETAYTRQSPSEELVDLLGALTAQLARLVLVAPAGTTQQARAFFTDVVSFYDAVVDLRLETGQHGPYTKEVRDIARRLGTGQQRLLALQIEDMQGDRVRNRGN
ncbi:MULTISPECIES: hypothetical protein [unclassified Geodermatophilus]|uniref:hypothetical protein n=1 Tax=unclassified Geodermatophilus TaxID=2637632 RepID=UPI003EE99844